MTVPFVAVSAPEPPGEPLELAVEPVAGTRPTVYVSAGARVALTVTVTERNGRDITGYLARCALVPTVAGVPTPDVFELADAATPVAGNPAQVQVTRYADSATAYLGRVKLWVSLTGPAGTAVVPAGVWKLA